MNTETTPAATATARKRRKRAARAQQRARRARNFFIIAAMATFVSVGGHCLTGDDGASPTRATTELSSGQ